MTKKIQEISLSFLLIACGISIIMGILWLKPVIESHRSLIEDTRINQDLVIKSAQETKTIITEFGYAAAVLAMLDNKMIQPVDANKMIEESIKTISVHSERLGNLAKIVNDYRINEQAR